MLRDAWRHARATLRRRRKFSGHEVVPWIRNARRRSREGYQGILPQKRRMGPSGRGDYAARRLTWIQAIHHSAVVLRQISRLSTIPSNTPFGLPFVLFLETHSFPVPLLNRNAAANHGPRRRLIVPETI